MGHVAGWALVWSGLAEEVAVVPRPPPTWPTITSDVGTGAGKLLVRLIVKVAVPEGTLITTGDQPVAAVFKAVQVAGATAAVQLYPHIGTADPSGSVAVDEPAVKLTLLWPRDTPLASRRMEAASPDLIRTDL
jgi:hypothetical protein